MTSSSNFRMTMNARFAIAAAALLGVAGCQKPMPDYVPVSGTVLVNDEPAGGLYLQFYGPEGASPPEGASLAPPDGGKTDPDGTFKIPLHGPGKYTVTAFWPTVTVVEGEEIEGEDRFNGRFRSSANTAMKITVQRGVHELPPIRFTYP